MDTKLYVGNVSRTTTNDTLLNAFAEYGVVSRARVVRDRETNAPRGFAFVDMSEGADRAVAGLNGVELDGSILSVQIARPRNDLSIKRAGFY